MSLTSVLKQKYIISKFKEELKYPVLGIKDTIKAVPLTKHYSLVGTSFDYLLKFYLEVVALHISTSLLC